MAAPLGFTVASLERIVAATVRILLGREPHDGEDVSFVVHTERQLRHSGPLLVGDRSPSREGRSAVCLGEGGADPFAYDTPLSLARMGAHDVKCGSVARRLLPLRGWSDERANDEQIFG